MWFRTCFGDNKEFRDWAKVSTSTHTHSYLPLTGGTLSGNIAIDKASTANEANIVIKGKAGNLSVYSTGSDTGIRGVYTYNAKGTGAAVIRIDQSNYVITDLPRWTFSNSIYTKTTNSGLKVDATLANPSSASYQTGLTLVDYSGTTYGVFEAELTTTGAVSVYPQVKRVIGGTNVYNAIRLRINKDKTLEYVLGSAAAMRKALGLGNTSGPVPIGSGGTGVAAESMSCLDSKGLLYNIGIRAGTGTPSTDTARKGWIYIQYA